MPLPIVKLADFNGDTNYRNYILCNIGVSYSVCGFWTIYSYI